MRSWNIKTYNTNSLLKKEVITDVLDLFWEECIQTIESNESIVLVIRFQKNNKQFNTISVLQVNTNKETLINSIEEKSIPFYNTYVSNIEISYNVKSGEINPA
jgi:hypothetical protein